MNYSTSSHYRTPPPPSTLNTVHQPPVEQKEACLCVTTCYSPGPCIEDLQPCFTLRTCFRNESLDSRIGLMDGLWRALLLVEGDVVSDVVGDQHGHHQAVDGDDPRHDHGDDGLHDELRTHHRHGRDARAALCRAVCRAQGWRDKRRDMRHR